MQVRMKCDVRGSYYGIQAKHLTSVERGDIIDLDPVCALHEVRNDRVELALTGPIGPRTPGANVRDLATLEKLCAQEAKAKQPAERTRV